MNFKKISTVAFCLLYVCLSWSRPLSNHVISVPLPDNIITNKNARANVSQFLFSYDLTTSQDFSRVYIDIDHNPETGFPQGGIAANYLIENDSLYKYVGPGWKWEKVKEICTSEGDFKQWILERKDLIENQCTGSVDYLYQVESDEGTSTALKMNLSYPKTDDCVEEEGQRIAVPSYFYPCDEEGCFWEQMIHTAPVTGITVINPRNGPGDSISKGYEGQVIRAKAAGVDVLGYVHTLYGERDLQTVKNEIDKFYEWYGVDGIFLDEGYSRDCDRVKYYQEIQNHIRSKGGKATSVLNFGTRGPECYINAADILLTFESRYDKYLDWEPSGWEIKYPASRFWHLIYDVKEEQLKDIVNLSKQRHAGWVYITSDDKPNPWNSLPHYWDEEVKEVAQG